MIRPRRVATVLHRCVGLMLAPFLIVVGLTGAALAWSDALERVFAPTLFVLPPGTLGPTLDPFALRDAAARAVPGFAVNVVDFTRRPDEPARFYVDPRPGGAAPQNDEIALDPRNGRVVGARRHGDLGQGAVNLMPFIYDLHDSLAAGDLGITLLGLVALAWTVDCFVGAYLTFPAHGTGAVWLRRWRSAWLVRPGVGGFKRVFDLHRAGGLWPWLLVAVIAWSSVGFNLPLVYRPVTAALFGEPPAPPPPPPRDPTIPPRLDWREAHREAREAMTVAARRDSFVVRAERLMFYDPATHRYAYRVRSSRDPGKLGNTQLFLDGDTGAVSPVDLPTGRNAGRTFTAWIGELHTAGVWGATWQAVLTVIGLGVVLLSVTGVLVWYRKRVARRTRNRTHSA